MATPTPTPTAALPTPLSISISYPKKQPFNPSATISLCPPWIPLPPRLLDHHLATRRRRKTTASCCLPTREEEQEEEEEGGAVDDGRQVHYLVREFGWGVREMETAVEELRSVAHLQVQAFHAPLLLFNDFFFHLLKAELLSDLIYEVTNSPPDSYVCLVAEDLNASEPSQAPFERIVGVVDCTVRDDGDVLRHLDGVHQYLYLTGMAVSPAFRRQKVGTALLKACEELSILMDCKFLALRAYEDDHAATSLYWKAGYRVVSMDPAWLAWVGRRRRVLMVKELPVHDQIE